MDDGRLPGEQHGRGGAEPHNERVSVVMAEGSGQGPAQTGGELSPIAHGLACHKGC